MFAEEWTQHAYIQFKYVDDPAAEIRIRFDNNGVSQTAVGSQAKSVSSDWTMRYGWLNSKTPDDEFRRTVLHEFGHALGLVHEHQNPSAGIRWRQHRVYEDCKALGWSEDDVKKNIFDRYAADRTQHTPEIDTASIMIYPIPPEWTEDNFSVQWNTTLSENDKLYISYLYPK